MTLSSAKVFLWCFQGCQRTCTIFISSVIHFIHLAASFCKSTTNTFTRSTHTCTYQLHTSTTCHTHPLMLHQHKNSISHFFPTINPQTNIHCTTTARDPLKYLFTFLIISPQGPDVRRSLAKPKPFHVVKFSALCKVQFTNLHQIAPRLPPAHDSRTQLASSTR